MLISSTELAPQLDNPKWVIFDCRHDLMDAGKGERLYREGHVLGAHFANLDTDLSGEKTGRNGRHPLPSPVAFAAFLARHGVTAESTLVAYDDAGGAFAARLWWMCRWIGLANANLLDGGITKWVADGHALPTAVPQPKHTPLAAHANSLMLVSADELLPRLGSRELVLIDARAPERYRGDVEPIDPIAGHIPGARNRFYKENLNADLTLKSPQALHDAFTALIGDDAAEVVNQCGSGVTACANVFAMTYAGFPMPRLYAGSWSEWVSEPSRPVAKG